ncbi:MAG: hypothetical protein LBD03_09635 [Methanobrevibacter sp.]|nr:hypothetical protein [Candidatus Methanovirga procula]
MEKSDFNKLFNKVGMDRISLMDFNSLSDDMTPLLFQTGYLTVKDTEKKFGSVRYSLDFPNHEVEESFYLNLLSELTKISRSQIKYINNKLKEYLIVADEENMRLELKSMISKILNLIHLHSHSYYQSAI